MPGNLVAATGRLPPGVPYPLSLKKGQRAPCWPHVAMAVALVEALVRARRIIARPRHGDPRWRLSWARAIPPHGHGPSSMEPPIGGSTAATAMAATHMDPKTPTLGSDPASRDHATMP